MDDGRPVRGDVSESCVVWAIRSEAMAITGREVGGSPTAADADAPTPFTAQAQFAKGHK